MPRSRIGQLGLNSLYPEQKRGADRHATLGGTKPDKPRKHAKSLVRDYSRTLACVRHAVKQKHQSLNIRGLLVPFSGGSTLFSGVVPPHVLVIGTLGR